MSTVVIGAGISGLGLAFRLAGEGRDVLVLEAGPRAGGVIRSERVGGLLVEHGAGSLRGGAVHARRLAEALGVADRIVEASPAARARHILWDGRLEPLPRALLSPRFLPPTALLRALAEPLIPRRDPPRPDESVFGFFSRRFGRAVAERLVDPFVAGVYGGDAHSLEAAAAFPDVTAWEARYGSVLLGAMRRPKAPPGPRTPFSFRDGLETLTRALAERLGDRLRLSAPVERVVRDGAGFRIDAPGGPYDAERVVVAVPGARAAAFLPDADAELAPMPTSKVASVHLAWPADAVPEPLASFGWLAPSSQRTDVLGCLWVSSVFPSHAPGHVLLRVMLGGARDPRRVSLAPERLIDEARRVVAEIHGLSAPPSFAHAVVPEGIPQYERGHAARVARLREAVPGLSFLGWGYTGVGVEHGLAAAAAWDG